MTRSFALLLLLSACGGSTGGTLPTPSGPVAEIDVQCGLSVQISDVLVTGMSAGSNGVTLVGDAGDKVFVVGIDAAYSKSDRAVLVPLGSKANLSSWAFEADGSVLLSGDDGGVQIEGSPEWVALVRKGAVVWANPTASQDDLHVGAVAPGGLWHQGVVVEGKTRTTSFSRTGAVTGTIERVGVEVAGSRQLRNGRVALWGTRYESNAQLQEVGIADEVGYWAEVGDVQTEVHRGEDSEFTDVVGTSDGLVGTGYLGLLERPFLAGFDGQGKRLWMHEHAETWDSLAVVGDTVVALKTTAAGQRLIGYDPASGRERWITSVPDHMDAHIVRAHAGGLIVAGSSEHDHLRVHVVGPKGESLCGSSKK